MRRLLIVGLAVAGLGFAGYLAYTVFYERVADVELAELLVEDVALPPDFQLGDEVPTTTPIDWQLERAAVQTNEICGFEADGLRRRWTDGGRPAWTPDAQLTVCSYLFPSAARARFDRTDPLETVGIGLTPDWRATDAAPDALDGIHAAQARLWCVSWTAERDTCPIWIYHARYGQYVVNFQFAYLGAEAGGITVDEFLVAARSVDAVVADRLRLATENPATNRVSTVVAAARSQRHR